MSNLNNMAFTPEEVEAGALQKLLNYLIDYNTNNNKHYCDIHMTTDGYCIIVEWAVIPYSHEWGGYFYYVNEDEEIAHWFALPDNSRVLCLDQDDEIDAITNFRLDNPEWHYDSIKKEWSK